MKPLLTVLTLSALSIVSAIPAPGLLRVPKVYNALVTSNQNLSPSRAFPVIQPVVHTTAVGYVPPFYYAQFAPRYPGPEVGRLPQELLPAEGAGLVTNAAKDAANSNSGQKDQDEKNLPALKTSDDETPKRKNGNEPPLSFYPNYHSLYYDPYLYTYNGFNAHLAPNPYIFDYQPQALAPALPPQGIYRDQQLLEPNLPQGDVGNSRKNSAEKIPDVPPPPVPTSSSNKS